MAYDQDFDAASFCKEHEIELTYYSVSNVSTQFVARKNGKVIGTKEHFGGWWNLSLGPWLRLLLEKGGIP